MFIVSVFTIAKKWNRPRCSSTDEWIEKICYRYTMEYYSVIEKNEMMPFVGKWMELEIIMLRETSQTQRDKVLHIFSHMGKRKEKKNDLKVEEGLLGIGKGTGKEEENGGQDKVEGRWTGSKYDTHKYRDDTITHSFVQLTRVSNYNKVD
jgi:hypothetical protein